MDCTITTDKIAENESNIKLFDVKDFLRFISIPAQFSKCSQNLLINCEGDHRLVEKGAKQIIHKLKTKIIFVTSNLISTKTSQNQDNGGARSSLSKVIAEDKITWDDLTLLHQEEVEVKICKMFKMFRSEIISGALETLEGQILIDVINGRKPCITKDNFPAEIRFYVPRRFVPKNKLTNNIFSNKFRDIFLFTGIERYQLAELLTDGGGVDSSLNQILGGAPTCRFIILDEPTHFFKICQLTHCPVHLISYENQILTWVKSRGGMYAIQQSVDIKMQTKLNEMEMVDRATKTDKVNQPVCISDTAGMGKTILLAKIGRIIQQSCPEKLVMFAIVSDFLQLLKAKLFSTLTDEVKLKVVKEILVEYACDYLFGKCLLHSEFETDSSEKVSLELLLDGFDEVFPRDFDLAYECFSMLTEKLKHVRIWVTTRPHFLHPL